MHPRRSGRVAKRQVEASPEGASYKKQAVLNEEAEKWRDAAEKAKRDVMASEATLAKTLEDMEAVLRQNDEFKEELDRLATISRDNAETAAQYEFMKNDTLPGLIRDMEELKRKFVEAEQQAEDARRDAADAELRAREAELRASGTDAQVPYQTSEYDKMLSAAVSKRKALEQGIHLASLEAKNIILQRQFDASIKCLKEVRAVSVDDMSAVMLENLRESVTVAFSDVVPEDKAVYQSTLEELMKSLAEARM